MKNNYIEFENEIGYHFKDINLLITALTHSSASNSNNYERLEFLGDSLLSIIVADYLYSNTNKKVGEMSVLRSNLVSTDALSKLMIDHNWKDMIIVGQSILATHSIAKNILADVFESIIGALYLDDGFERVKDFVTRYVLSGVNTVTSPDYKTKLQELLASINHEYVISYKLLDSSGPSHNMRFNMGLYIDGFLQISDIGSSKKEAEQSCAKMVYDRISKNGIGSIIK